MSECGWKDAANVCQQDVSEAFTFIAETLELPHLTLKMDIFHTGKEDATDDHKLINERLLEVGIPEPPTDGRNITLEDCLEEYFNNKIEVKRMLARRNTVSSTYKGDATHVETAELGSEPATPASFAPLSPIVWSPVATTPSTRDRSHSLIRDRPVPEDGESSVSGTQARPQRSSSMRKEVMMPAWQFFSLIRSSPRPSHAR